MKKFSSKFPGKRVLVADDYFVNQEVTQDILELMDFDVEVADNGKEAVEKHENNNTACIYIKLSSPT